MPEPLQNLQHQIRLLDRVRLVIRARHYSPRTETAYVGWIRRFILFHGKRHPVEMGEPEVTQFALGAGERAARLGIDAEPGAERLVVSLSFTWHAT